MPKELIVSREKLEEIIKAISLSSFWAGRNIPASDLLTLKENLESREELSDYQFYYSKPIRKFNSLFAEKKTYGGQKNA